MNTLDAYIEAVFDFEKNQDPAGYAERSGPPEELPAVIGLISLNFQGLEDEISTRIVQMSGLNSELGEIMTAELSFKNKVNLFASLYYKLKDSHHFSSINGHEEGYFRELLNAFTKCEEFRNQILHSRITKDWRTQQITRKKVTAKAKKGLRKVTEEVDIPYLYNIADYIAAMIMEADQFFIDFGPKPTSHI